MNTNPLEGSEWIDQRKKHYGKVWRVVRCSNHGITAADGGGGSALHRGGTHHMSPRAQISFDELAKFFEPKEAKDRDILLRVMEMQVNPLKLESEVRADRAEALYGKVEATRECTSSYHKGNRFIPVSRYSKSQLTGELKKHCDECTAKAKAARGTGTPRRKQKADRIQAGRVVPPTTHIVQEIQSSNGSVDSSRIGVLRQENDGNLWRITSIIRRSYTVNSLDLVVNAITSPDEEVVKIEKL